jgi:formylglycine-generating enzyme required for sulfatase activity
VPSTHTFRDALQETTLRETLVGLPADRQQIERRQVRICLNKAKFIVACAVILGCSHAHDGGEQAALQADNDGNTVTNSIGMKLKLIKSGSFLMGIPSSVKNERSQHWVRISREYYIGVHEVTQGQWEAVMDTRPWKRIVVPPVEEDPSFPVVYVTWEDAVAFCNRLSEMEGATYRLPTEAEWEYCCRAGTATFFSFGDSQEDLADYAWFWDNASHRAHKVGLKRPNEWGLYDMSGNVEEWCQDRYSDYENAVGVFAARLKKDDAVVDPTGPIQSQYRVLRGGSWQCGAASCGSGRRNNTDPRTRLRNIGFRVVRVAEPNEKSTSKAESEIQ